MMIVLFNKFLYAFFAFLVTWLFLLNQVSSFSTAATGLKITAHSFFPFDSTAAASRSGLLCKETKKHCHRLSLHSTINLLFAQGDDKNNNDDDESASSLSEIESNDNIKNNVPFPVASKYMTALEISHREKEIELLAKLATTDLVIKDFRELWRSERGSKMEEKILRAWKDLGHPDLWSQCEKLLLELIKNDPTYLYPFVFLSKLYCLQGRFEESQKICESVLQLKPYHFVVIENMVANSFALQDQSQIQCWEMKRLPKPTQKLQRLAWVKQAIEDATKILEEAKESNIPRTAAGDNDGGTNGNDYYGIMLDERNANDDDGDDSSRNVWH